jgi:hypothetical protein
MEVGLSVSIGSIGWRTFGDGLIRMVPRIQPRGKHAKCTVVAA